MTSQQMRQQKIMPETHARAAWLHAVRNWLLRRVWYVQFDVTLLLAIPPPMAMQVLARTARPSVQRLEFRNLFANRRRYAFSLRHDGGFQITTTHGVFWHSRRRTQPTAIVNGTFSGGDDRPVRLTLRGHIRLFYLIESFFMPTFMASMLIFMPWDAGLIAGLCAAFYALSWLGYRSNAALEAHHMVFFIEQALQDHLYRPPVLTGNGAGVIYEARRDFEDAWEQFMASQHAPGDALEDSRP